MPRKSATYDIIIVGAGHAGCEAALACARLKAKTLLITLNKENIALLSCNPAIGGLGKGQLVKEIDALGGQMARAADACGIQFKILNASKGPAVRSTRVQVDMFQYKDYMRSVVEEQSGLEILEDEVIDLKAAGGRITGVACKDKGNIKARAVIIATGTFLGGLIHIGMKHYPGGRLEDKSAPDKLTGALKRIGFKIMRFKTGTCARLDGGSIDFSKMIKQLGDKPPKPFSFSTEKIRNKQIPCFITHTNKKTRQIIEKGLKYSPLYTGKITGCGVRYCPSLEDKIVKFPHHERHQVFLEPEGRQINEYYPNGLSTSLPEDVQDKFIRSVRGLEKVKINRYGYGIEHDVIDARELYATLESKEIKNLYLAGQINGTTGYEEAAAQGLIAGLNAALALKKKEPLILDRASSYIGVLIDDLVTKGTNEPYRMLTSRVEYRLTLREDNADLRLREIGYKCGLVGKKLYQETKEKKKKIAELKEKLNEIKIKDKKGKISLYQYLKRPNSSITRVKKKIEEETGLKFSRDIFSQAEIDIKYSGFIKRQQSQINKFKDLEKIKVPADIDYKGIPSLSLEIKEKLSSVRPHTLGQASRISGITPAAVAFLMVYLKKYTHERRNKKK